MYNVGLYAIWQQAFIQDFDSGGLHKSVGIREIREGRKSEGSGGRKSPGGVPPARGAPRVGGGGGARPPPPPRKLKVFCKMKYQILLNLC